eukprot:755368-Hanusia_phi.AAC.2
MSSFPSRAVNTAGAAGAIVLLLALAAWQSSSSSSSAASEVRVPPHFGRGQCWGGLDVCVRCQQKYHIYMYAGLAVDNKHQTGFIAKEIRKHNYQTVRQLPCAASPSDSDSDGPSLHFFGRRHLPCGPVGSGSSLPGEDQFDITSHIESSVVMAASAGLAAIRSLPWYQ